MSVVPFTTQNGNGIVTQSSQWTFKVALVHTDKITDRQLTVMKECQNLLNRNVGTLVCKTSELDSLPISIKYFVIPTYSDDLVNKIKNRFEKRRIFLPRVVIEARSHFNCHLPVRNFAVSLSMMRCHVFLVKSCAKDDIRQKINEMCGDIVSSFSDSKLNVLVTDRSDNRYCQKAIKRNITVVSDAWVTENFKIACQEDASFYNYDSLSSILKYQIRPFLGLYFKINTTESVSEVKKMILENQGSIVYGDDSRLTHIVTAPMRPGAYGNSHTMEDYIGSEKANLRPKTVDIDFLRQCVSLGRYLDTKEYCERQLGSGIMIKQERISPTPDHRENNCAPSVLSPVMLPNKNVADNNALLMPPPTPRSVKQNRQQAETLMDLDMALSSMETAATQPVSTQMRRLPEPELRIEQTFEPSQHLYWNEKRNF